MGSSSPNITSRGVIRCIHSEGRHASEPMEAVLIDKALLPLFIKWEKKDTHFFHGYMQYTAMQKENSKLFYLLQMNDNLLWNWVFSPMWGGKIAAIHWLVESIRRLTSKMPAQDVALRKHLILDTMSHFLLPSKTNHKHF